MDKTTVLARLAHDKPQFHSEPSSEGRRKAQLGHSSIQVTVDRYRHFIPGANRAAVDRLADATQGGRAVLHLDSTWTSGDQCEGVPLEPPASA